MDLHRAKSGKAGEDAETPAVAAAAETVASETAASAASRQEQPPPPPQVQPQLPSARVPPPSGRVTPATVTAEQQDRQPQSVARAAERLDRTSDHGLAPDRFFHPKPVDAGPSATTFEAADPLGIREAIGKVRHSTDEALALMRQLTALLNSQPPASPSSGSTQQQHEQQQHRALEACAALLETLDKGVSAMTEDWAAVEALRGLRGGGGEEVAVQREEEKEGGPGRGGESDEGEGRVG
ncbi:hypothetical protein DFJ73DRAFT_957729 [Zopfochytrium polystomum]|nr:hypothetical protein DFJ73DRAFT_957729 [Zopfochytrium polystomum]